MLTQGYTGDPTQIQDIRTLAVLAIGDVGLQDDLQQVDDEMDATSITGHAGFYARGLTDGSGNAKEDNGHFSTVWRYAIVDNTNTIINTVDFTFKANDTSINVGSKRAIGVIEVVDCNTITNGENILVYITGTANIGDTVLVYGEAGNAFNGEGKLFMPILRGRTDVIYEDFSELITFNYLIRIATDGKITEIVKC